MRLNYQMIILMSYRDQEMRFTVHDSPDYYQLKVSVFNDDKKTELIGETWVALEQIVVPGGGQNDVWHTLNCKGRYAGEIRIELTYYDTRPREEKAEKRLQSAPMDIPTGPTGSGVGGPRQPKPVKRRPLPADPTDPSRPSPLPYTPPQDAQQRFGDSPDGYGVEPTPVPDVRYQNSQSSNSRRVPLENTQPQQHVARDSSNFMTPSPHHPAVDDHDTFEPAHPSSYQQSEINVPNYALHDEYNYEDSHIYGEEDSNNRPSKPFIQPLQQGMINSHSSPAVIDARPRINFLHGQHYLGSSTPKSYSYEEGPTLPYATEDPYHVQSGGFPTPVEDEEPPPPPPLHRNSGSRPSPQAHGRMPPEQYNPIPTTAPLNVRNPRGSVNGSPLAQVQSNHPYADYPTSPSVSISHSNSQSQPAPSVSSHASYSQLRNRRSQSPMRDYGQSVPPSLVPGYEPSIAEDESERIMHENRMSVRHHYSDPPRPQFQQAQIPVDPQLPQYQQAPSPIEQQLSYAEQTPAQTPQSRPQPRSRNVEAVQERRAHRASAPIIQPQVASPDPRTPLRKSVGPNPGSAPAERRSSGIPFSPDSFDAFNPSMSAASSVNEPGARYNTPEQAKEAARQHERREKLGDGPIIGNDGRIIDPSDHLPTDTWAPEPEQKAPKKGPQVTMRFRRSPQGAQPMPAARRPAVEHTVSTPVYTHSPNNSSPTGAGRSRLQKKPGAPVGHPASSPSVPTLNTTPRSSPLRPSEPNYPLRERENYGGYGSSPTYGRSSQGNLPPPIPGKVPISEGQEDLDSSALSEEMRQINIGVGHGQGRSRRSKFGF